MANGKPVSKTVKLDQPVEIIPVTGKMVGNTSSGAKSGPSGTSLNEPVPVMPANGQLVGNRSNGATPGPVGNSLKNG